MYDFIRGPLLWVSFIVFICGLAFQVYRLISITRKKETPFLIQEGTKKTGPGKLKHYVARTVSITNLKGTVLGRQPHVALLTFIFHASIIVTPLVVLGHNILLFESWRFRLFSLSESATDIMTVVFLVCTALFLIRRIAVPTVRSVSGVYDYILMVITAAPFLTGFIAYHQLVNYETIMTVHILAGELMLIAVGLTKLGHMIFFFFVRLNVGSEYSFRGGSRTW
jgi:nitrate reductase gamma subunit